VKKNIFSIDRIFLIFILYYGNIKTEDERMILMAIPQKVNFTEIASSSKSMKRLATVLFSIAVFRPGVSMQHRMI
jgi:uncharacterized membrane protein YhaH (DUF805 family)